MCEAGRLPASVLSGLTDFSWEWLLSAQAAFSAAPSMGRWIEQETGSEVTRVFLSPAVGS